MRPEVRIARYIKGSSGIVRGYLREVYIAEHTRRCAVGAAEAGSAFVPFLGG
jgi:hypothetical protein